MIEFPDGFIWGTATAAHQIEGGNWNNDWWAWEHDPDSPCAEPSGDACDSWHRWPEDVALCRDLGFGSYRFSLEWSRIEPEEGEWSHAAVDHYRAQCQALLDAGLDPVVTLHHFTTPRWVAAKGGWEEPETAERFASYCGRVTEELAPVLRRVCTINEPNIVSVAGYLGAYFPPGKRDVEARRKVNRVFVDAHRRAVEAVRSSAPGVPVGLTLAMSDYQAVDGGGGPEEGEASMAKLEQIRHRMEDEFLAVVDGDDFLGVQTYTRTRVGPHGVIGPAEDETVLQMGYEYWPQSLEATLRRAWEVTGGKVPLLVTENGIGTEDDAQRIAYVAQALRGVHRCIADGLDVRGYTYWSLVDNFEWAEGYLPTFGLVEVDRTTFVRRPKPSARWLGEVAQKNALDPAGLVR